MAPTADRTALGLVMARIIDPLAGVRPGASVADAHRLMLQRGAPALPVLEGTHQIGSITLETAGSFGFESGATLVRDVMEGPLPELDESTAFETVASVIAGSGAALITREDFPIGLLTEDDVRRA
jgi:predicted transcriptional regulator